MDQVSHTASILADYKPFSHPPLDWEAEPSICIEHLSKETLQQNFQKRFKSTSNFFWKYGLVKQQFNEKRKWLKIVSFSRITRLEVSIMFPILSSFFAPKPAQNQKPTPKSENPAKDNGPLLLELVYNNSPALMDSLELSSKAKKEDLPSPLLYASPTRDSKQHLKTIDTECVNEDGDTVLTRTANYGDYPNATRKLIQAGANLDRKDEKGRDPLTLNTVNAHPKALKEILDIKTEKIKQEKEDPISDIRTLFDDDEDVIAETYDPRFSLNQDKEGKTALHHAIQQKNYDALYQLTEAPIETDDVTVAGDTALHQAAMNGDSYAIIRLMKAKPDTAVQDQEGKTPLMHWILNSQPPGYLATSSYMAGRKLFAHKWGLPAFHKASLALGREAAESINLQDGQGRTALSYMADSPWASSITGISAAGLLGSAGSNVDLPDKNGLTPLMHFAKRKPKSYLELGASPTLIYARSHDINRQDPQGKTALIHAAENGNLAALMGNLMFHSTENIFPGLSHENPENPINVDIQDKSGQTALMALAAFNATEWDPSVWMQAGAKAYKTLAQRSPRLRGSLDSYAYKNPIANMTHFVVKAGANPRLTNKAGETALMIAAKGSNLPVLGVLGKQQEALEIKDKKGHTALELAVMNHQFEAAKLLLKAGANPAVLSAKEKAQLMPKPDKNTKNDEPLTIPITIM